MHSLNKSYSNSGWQTYQRERQNLFNSWIDNGRLTGRRSDPYSPDVFRNSARPLYSSNRATVTERRTTFNSITRGGQIFPKPWRAALLGAGLYLPFQLTLTGNPRMGIDLNGTMGPGRIFNSSRAPNMSAISPQIHGSILSLSGACFE